MARDEGAARLGGTDQNWLAYQATIGIASNAPRAGSADVVFAFHDQEEIGPRMLARLARRTGLSPSDL